LDANSFENIKISAINNSTGNSIERKFSPKNINNNHGNFAIGFNCGYLLEILGKMKAETVHLNFNSPVGACVIRANDYENFFLLMPLRLTAD
jgi:DNA polymerase III sliding clamp (beta) subunit (PCNA family)